MFWIPTNHDKKSIKQNQGKTLDILVHIEGNDKKDSPIALLSDQSRPQTSQWIHGTPQKGANGYTKVVDMTPVRNNRTRPPSKESSMGKSILIPELKKGDNRKEHGKIGLRKKYSRTQSEDAVDFSDVDSIDNDTSSVSSHQSRELFVPMQITIGKKNGILVLESEEDEISLSDASSFHIDYMDDSTDNSINDMKEYDQDGDSRDDFNDEHNHIEYRRKNNSTSFELESTKHQNHKDDKRKKYHQIRIACLEVAIESYKKAKVEVPEVSSQ